MSLGRASRVGVGVALGLLSTAACRDGEVTAAAEASINQCVATSDCAAAVGATCDPKTRLCRLAEPAGFDVTYVISFPSTAFPVAGKTVAIARKALLGCRPLPRSCTQPGDCVCVSESRTGTRAVADAYRVTGTTANDLGFGLGKGQFSLPVRALFRPLSPLGVAGLLASSARVPLENIEAESASDEVLGGQPPGPGDARAQGFIATLPGGKYLRSLEPLPPFDGAFPPVTGVVEVGVDATGATVDAVKRWGTPAQPFVLDSLEDVAGWRLYFRDRGTGIRVSNIYSPRFGRNDVRLFTFGYTDLTQTPVDIVVEPPPSQAQRPSLISPVFIVPGTERMPRLPAPERVAGSVIGNPEGVPLGAKLRFRSVVDADEVSQLEPINAKLRYSTEVSTTLDGRYEVLLPPGRYDVAVIPELASGFATTTRALTLPSGSGGDGRAFVVERLRRIEGLVRLPGGAPLVGAVVRARPSTVPLPPRPFASLARTRTAVTNGEGAFAVDVDPGLYDLVVEPPTATRWPVSVALGVDVPEGLTSPSVRLTPIELTAPFDLGFTLVNEGSGRVVSGAFVRAFSLASDRGVPVELAHGTTDRAGRVDLYAAQIR